MVKNNETKTERWWLIRAKIQDQLMVQVLQEDHQVADVETIHKKTELIVIAREQFQAKNALLLINPKNFLP